MTQENAEAHRLLRKMQRLQQRLEAVWEDPTQYPEVDESDLRRRISKAEDDLYALGYRAPRADLVSHSAFEIHGTSNFLQAGPSPVEEILGVRQRGIRKGEDVAVENCLTLGTSYGGDR